MEFGNNDFTIINKMYEKVEHLFSGEQHEKFKKIAERGKDFSWKGRLYTGALNVYNSSILIDESIIRFNAGDDAINLKYSKSIIKNPASAGSFIFSFLSFARG